MSPQPESLDRAVELFNLDYGSNCQQMLKCFRMEDFITNINDTLGLAVKTLSRLMRDYKRGKETRVGHFVQEHKCYWNITTFKEFNISQFGCQLCEVWVHPRCVETIESGLVYKGSLVLTNLMYGDLVELVGEDFLNNLNAALDAMKTDLDVPRFTQCYEVVMEVLWSAIVNYTLDSLYGPGHSINRMGVDHIYDRIRQRNFILMSSKEFARWIFSVTTFSQKSIPRIISALHNIVGPERMHDLYNFCREQTIRNYTWSSVPDKDGRLPFSSSTISS
ncbi:unnamed protein product [Orchesella dallaii]|uniref:Uncharacterized protein n=1 Tax=Orchesella dallaii TaxID=48710 RepID=A0ABP1R2F5_9HEXA